ncbi:organic cation/carnitine transporter 2-like [Bolinopsis microptera]|uniref:organic cation/carnitine transporter 2-like n=1 Tax=Bolinopsis microptera TaxID=2820187 RepID=UPI00307AC8CD
MGFSKLDDDEEEPTEPTKDEGPISIDQAVDKIWNGLNIKIVLVFISAVGSAYLTAAEIYITIFTGIIPYTDWTCISEKCFGLLIAATPSNNSQTFYSHSTMCGNKLQAGLDFKWTSERTSFSMDWGFYCDTETKLTVVSSFFFIGAFVGLLSSTAIFDRTGRRNGAIGGSVIAAAATVAATWIPSYEGLLVVRVFQGFGQFINFTGVYCWVIEFAPSHLRSSMSSILLICWSFGYLVIVLIGYLIPVWNYIFLATGILNFLFITPLLIYPKSPRFSLVRGKEEEARETLAALGRICNNKVEFAAGSLTFKARKQNYFQQLKDFKKYPTLRKETLLCMGCWFIVACLFYGLSFGWSKISTDLYGSYLFAALGKVIAFTILIPICAWLGRKKTMLFFLVCGILSNFLAMPDVQLSENWTLEHVSCLLGSIAITAVFGQLYLFTSEIAPTSHRGMVMSLSSSAARVGSFLGTYINLLYDMTDRRVPLGVIAGATVLCGVAVCFLSDTTGRRIAETPEDVEVMSGNKKYQPVQIEAE